MFSTSLPTETDLLKEEVARYVTKRREQSRRLAEERADQIEAGLQHLTEAAERDKDRYHS